MANSPLSPAGSPLLVLLPRTFCSSVGCTGLGLAPAFLCGKVFMSLWRNERNKGSIHKPAQGYYRVSYMGLFLEQFYEITFMSCEALKIKFKGFTKRKCPPHTWSVTSDCSSHVFGFDKCLRWSCVTGLVWLMACWEMEPFRGGG